MIWAGATRPCRPDADMADQTGVDLNGTCACIMLPQPSRTVAVTSGDGDPIDNDQALVSACGAPDASGIEILSKFAIQ